MIELADFLNRCDGGPSQGESVRYLMCKHDYMKYASVHCTISALIRSINSVL